MNKERTIIYHHLLYTSSLSWGHERAGAYPSYLPAKGRFTPFRSYIVCFFLKFQYIYTQTRKLFKRYLTFYKQHWYFSYLAFQYIIISVILFFPSYNSSCAHMCMVSKFLLDTLLMLKMKPVSKAMFKAFQCHDKRESERKRESRKICSRTILVHSSVKGRCTFNWSGTSSCLPVWTPPQHSSGTENDH